MLGFSEEDRRWVRKVDAQVVMDGDVKAREGETVRWEEDVTWFHIFPRSERELQDNASIWEVVNGRSSLSNGGFGRGGKEIRALFVPRKVYYYLRSVTRREITTTILEILSDIVNFDDAQTNIVKKELAPSLWNELIHSMRLQDQKGCSDVNMEISGGCLHSAYLLDEILEDRLLPISLESSNGNMEECSPFLHWRIPLAGAVLVSEGGNQTDRDFTERMHKIGHGYGQFKSIFSAWREQASSASSLDIFNSVLPQDASVHREIVEKLNLMKLPPFSDMPETVVEQQIIPHLLSAYETEMDCTQEDVELIFTSSSPRVQAKAA